MKLKRPGETNPAFLNRLAETALAALGDTPDSREISVDEKLCGLLESLNANIKAVQTNLSKEIDAVLGAVLWTIGDVMSTRAHITKILDDNVQIVKDDNAEYAKNSRNNYLESNAKNFVAGSQAVLKNINPSPSQSHRTGPAVSPPPHPKPPVRPQQPQSVTPPSPPPSSAAVPAPVSRSPQITVRSQPRQPEPAPAPEPQSSRPASPPQPQPPKPSPPPQPVREPLPMPPGRKRSYIRDNTPNTNPDGFDLVKFKDAETGKKLKGYKDKKYYSIFVKPMNGERYGKIYNQYGYCTDDFDWETNTVFANY
jgi:hypothetical protein